MLTDLDNVPRNEGSENLKTKQDVSKENFGENNEEESRKRGRATKKNRNSILD